MNNKYDSAYDADDETDANEIKEMNINKFKNNYGYKMPKIDKQIFINIGNYLTELYNEPRDNMCRVLAELVALHPCREEPTTHTCTHVSACRRSISSELFSLCSNETDDTVFKYYISDDDEINIELT